MADVALDYRRALGVVGLKVKGSADESASTSPTITSGSGAPTHTEPTNSIYIRNNASDSDLLLYRSTDGAGTWETILGSELTDLLAATNAWTAANTFSHATGVTTDTLTERTAAAGVTIDGLLIKDEGIDMSGSGVATGDSYIKLKDNLADALSIHEGANDYVVFVTTDSSEKIQVLKKFDYDASDLDVSTQATSISVLDNSATSFVVKEASNAYITCDTTNSAEKVLVSQRLDVAAAHSTPMTAAQDIATGNTITLPSGGYFKSLDATAGAATGVILTAGTVAGQVIMLCNKHATNSITFAAAGTSNVANGASANIPALTAKKFVWNATESRWFMIG